MLFSLSYCSFRSHTHSLAELEAKRERERIRAFEESRWEDDPDFDDLSRRAKLRALYVGVLG